MRDSGQPCPLGPAICLSLEYEGRTVDGLTDEVAVLECRRRYLRCPPAVSVHHLHKLLRAKYGLSPQHRVDVMYAGEPLRPDLTLADIAYIYLWRTVNISIHAHL